MWDYNKNLHMPAMRVLEWEEKEKETKNVSEEIVAEISPNLAKA